MLMEQQRIFLTIPEHLEKGLEEDVLEFYAVEARNSNVPLIENIIRHLTMHIYAYAQYVLEGYVETTELVSLLKESLDETLNADKLKASLEHATFKDAYFAFRKNVEFYLKEHDFFYETNWVYADKTDLYEYEYVNIPLQKIW